jgi:membrane-bound metal-dependent hydrolase YbcI (DUF457 family)
MPLAVTHILLAIIIVDLFRDYVIKDHKKYFTLHTLLIAGIGGLLPDIDIPISWAVKFLGLNIPLLLHRGITHTLLFSLIFLVSGIILWKKKNLKIAGYFFVLSFGIFLHLMLDFVLGSWEVGVMWFWPIVQTPFKLMTVDLREFIMGLDAILLLSWLWHEEHKHKIVDFI